MPLSGHDYVAEESTPCIDLLLALLLDQALILGLLSAVHHSAAAAFKRIVVVFQSQVLYFLPRAGRGPLQFLPQLSFVAVDLLKELEDFVNGARILLSVSFELDREPLELPCFVLTAHNSAIVAWDHLVLVLFDAGLVHDNTHRLNIHLLSELPRFVGRTLTLLWREVLEALELHLLAELLQSAHWARFGCQAEG